MNYSQAFQDHWGNTIPVLRIVCQGMDEQETWLESVRLKLGFDADWHPLSQRQARVNPTTDVRWSAKCAAMNGLGDIGGLVQEICAWMDLMEVKHEEIAGALVEVNGTAVVEPLSAKTCPKCGKELGRGSAMHLKHCKGAA